ncbi:MAG: hypothetical protein U9Q22_03910 [Candidatus Altiarchaeota archaeon]|nr:hypothetical protein [Candidatus Altiarchaeota archaeon]
MKTTVILDDNIYSFLVRESEHRYGTRKKMSLVLNELIRKYIVSRKEMFGTTRPFNVSDIRDEGDRI